jgi:hypothetical protein
MHASILVIRVRETNVIVFYCVVEDGILNVQVLQSVCLASAAKFVGQI